MQEGTHRDYRRILLFLGLTIIIVWMMKYVLVYFLPLLVAVMIVVPLQRFCQRKGIPGKKGKGIMAGGILFGLLLLAALVLIGLGTLLVSRAQRVLVNITQIQSYGMEMISQSCAALESYCGLTKGSLLGWLQNAASGIFGSLTQSTTWFGRSMRYVIGVGRWITFGLVSFVCVILFAREIEAWQQGLLRVAVIEPSIDRLLSIILRIGKKLGGMMKTFVRTQSVILCCISLAAVLGLYVSGVPDAWVYGILAGILDVLPFIGTGIILVPIGVIRLIGGNYVSGTLVLVTYLVCVVIREILEPRLMGGGMRISPVAILVSVYAGVLFYGVSGVLLGPVTLLILTETAREIFCNIKG